jgi:hypothetical protein
MLLVRPEQGFGKQTRRPTCLRSELRAEGYDVVSAVPSCRESLRFDLSLEVSVFNLQEQNALCILGTLAMQELGWKLKKSMVAIIQNSTP